MSIKSKTDRFIDWFIPDTLLADREMRTRARMFLFSHLFGPFLGNVIPAYLFFADPSSHEKLAVLALSITSFWLYPLALRLTGRYELLSYISIQNLLFAVFWGCFFYGGVSSPFLPWLVTVPLLAFFYLGATPKSVLTIFLLVVGNGLLFVTAYHSGSQYRSHVATSDLQIIGIISIVSASIYVSMMAIFYARILDSQTELEAEAIEHLATAAELRAAASQADRAGAAKSEFLAKMSHELRTPLNAVIGYSQILLEDADVDNEPQMVADLDRIHSAGAHLLSIVNSILDLSKIEAGKMDVHNGDVDIEGLLDDLVVKYERVASSGNNVVTLAIDPELHLVHTDGAKLSRVVETLLTNSLTFTKSGTVSIVADRTIVDGTDILEIVVADTGCGIEPAVLPTLFDDFTKRNDQSASRFNGAGLGLPLGHRLCRLMDATLDIESTVGSGTRVTIRLPLTQSASPDAVSEDSLSPLLQAA